MALFAFKCVHNSHVPHLNSLFTIKSTHYGLRRNTILVQPKCRTTKYGLRSLDYLGARLWNDLPIEITDIHDFNMFQNILNTRQGPDDIEMYRHYV